MTISDQQNDYEAATSAEPRLCANNCGFFGSSATMNLCSHCFKASILRQSTNYTPKTTTAISENDVSFCGSHEPNQVSAPAADSPPKAAATNRCTTCRRKLGMLGFVCKCGDTFCGTHRFPDMHQCDFDFKVVGIQAIKDSNPVVKADKIVRF